ncbi:hypothetical protein HIM_10595 [Hirsutella minnesotensis 3608]|uniref:Protein kinase domain-containing protein n=1 Tax=Hirsutella minnesotensis 3608 TaxID=1043627 RepID=A0A0F8A234_9HYPO|nr:hypothetical protein HIM_10595 [Hirsutella minnesotensis 3608]
MDERRELCRVAVLQIHGGDGDGADIVFNFNGQRIAVSIFPSSSTRDRNRCSTQDRLIRLLGRAASDDVDDDEYEELENQILGVILDAGRPIFKTQSTLNVKLNSGRDLHSTIYPATLNFQLLDNCGKAVIVPIEPSEAYTLSANDAAYDSTEDDELGIDTTLPCYSTKAILTVDMFVQGGGHAASRVLVDGNEMFCKARGGAGGLIGTSVGRELECLQEVRKFPPPERDTSIRIPQLLGYVRHADTGRVVGFLREWVPGRRLRDMDVPAIPAQRRQKWIRQIREAVHALHAGGITWGDGKACNVVVDERDDAWLIDFGGGWTNGWVDAELADTVEGDKQAIDKIGEFLKVKQV